MASVWLHLDTLADKGGEISKGVIALIFGTGNSQEVALSFLDNDRLDESITKKEATGELREILRRDFGFDAPDGVRLEDLRQRLVRYVLMTDFISGLGEMVPHELSSVPVHTIGNQAGSFGEEGRVGRPAITATNKGKYETLFPAKNCAQIVPVKVKFFQIFPNEPKNDF